MIAVIGPTKCSAASFTNRAGSWSGPVEGFQHFSMCDIFNMEGILVYVRQTANKLEKFVHGGWFNTKRSLCGRGKMKIKLVWVEP